MSFKFNFSFNLSAATAREYESLHWPASITLGRPSILPKFILLYLYLAQPAVNINVYTHGEMLPAHAYPFFKRFSHFIGNYGGAWWEQEKEFAEFKGSIIMTTNCIKKPLESYKNRIFTTDMVAMPGVKHIANHDFSEAINTALNSEEMPENIKGTIDVGFARQTLVNSADAIIKMVEEGKIKKFVVMAGCDSNDKERVYYSELAGRLSNKLSDAESLSELLLYGLKGMAAYAYHAYVLNYSSHEVKKFIIKALSYLTNEEKNFDVLLNLVTECGKVGVNVMETLDKANTEHYGEPEPTKVLNGTKLGKSILISGHDLFELERLLTQTENKNINVYTHGEMLPAHAYPFFKRFSHFIGNYGGAWWEQEKEFAEFKFFNLMT